MKATIILFGLNIQQARSEGSYVVGIDHDVPERRFVIEVEERASPKVVADFCYSLTNVSSMEEKWKVLAGPSAPAMGIGDAVIVGEGAGAVILVCHEEGWAQIDSGILEKLGKAGTRRRRSEICDDLSV